MKEFLLEEFCFIELKRSKIHQIMPNTIHLGLIVVYHIEPHPWIQNWESYLSHFRQFSAFLPTDELSSPATTSTRISFTFTSHIWEEVPIRAEIINLILFIITSPIENWSLDPIKSSHLASCVVDSIPGEA